MKLIKQTFLVETPLVKCLGYYRIKKQIFENARVITATDDVAASVQIPNK